MASCLDLPWARALTVGCEDIHTLSRQVPMPRVDRFSIIVVIAITAACNDHTKTTNCPSDCPAGQTHDASCACVCDDACATIGRLSCGADVTVVQSCATDAN